MSTHVINRRDQMYTDSDMRPPITDFITLPPPNTTDPNHPSFVDVFKGKDDENFIFKSLVLSKFTGATAAFAILADACVGTRPTDTIGLLKRVNYWGTPLIGGGIAYTSTVCLMASLRNKHDQFNHLMGGWAAGAVFGAARKSIFFGLVTGTLVGIFGMAYKDSIIFNYQIHTDPGPRFQGLSISHRHDYSLQRKIPSNWTREAPAADC